ncbi:MAG: UDP-N-acetylglucosamine 1-carboxyvinyltransferase 1 [Firmicutes bacterium ADurb.Bin373]|nr:UDP-N-acetylglucosamine 1-carboxyvinyltransferase [Bacillota bacterium]OQA11190.1 MAG: UDP-N-acetylglucosamine 1-carboxyvinyltransferase 1 [Firmicutes bacterium ADurb.Bin373]
MGKILIKGGIPLRGRVKISGAKNASLALLCAAIMARNEIVLENVPDISDVRVMIEIINSLGARVSWEGPGVLRIVPPKELSAGAPFHLVKKLRASNLLLGPMLARFGQATVALPGGCNIGVRPMDLHFKGLTGLGANLSLEHGCVCGSTGDRLKGARVYLDFPSVGATENIMMAACLARGQTLIENAAKEPEIVDLANFLNAMGARVRGAGTDVIKISGVSFLAGGIRFPVIPDRIEAGTFMVAAAATGGDITIENMIPAHVQPLSAKLREANAEIIEGGDTLRVFVNRPLKSIDIKTMPYPGFPTDMQSQLMAMLSVIPGTSVLVENIFENRFMVADELKRMGARIKVEGRMAVIEGVDSLEGAHVKATDLRAGAALIVAGLIASGETEICNIAYIDRGYHNLGEKLKSLGAIISRK